MVEKHAFHDIGIKNVAVDTVAHGDKAYRVTTIDFGGLSDLMFFVHPFETAINTNPIERYSRRRDAIAGHARYVKLLREGWVPNDSV